ncbi:uncharacterized protein [Bombus fervidus]|uniref:uncharacterized protein n=1 Tax=Bombus fervidus TaxID=203811 RepID=UPI003D189CD6
MPRISHPCDRFVTGEHRTLIDSVLYICLSVHSSRDCHGKWQTLSRYWSAIQDHLLTRNFYNHEIGEHLNFAQQFISTNPLNGSRIRLRFGTSVATSVEDQCHCHSPAEHGVARKFN